jgi:PD-(D/E)XK nuclease superfamily
MSITLSMSAIQTYQRCPMKFSIQQLAGLEDIRPESEALKSGTTIHRLLELAAKGLPWEEDGPMNEVVADYLKYNPLPKNILSADDPQYVHLKDFNVRIRTTFDLVYSEDNMLVIRDYKSFANAPSLDIERNFQARCYVWAATQIWPDYEVYKFEHEYIRRTPPFVPKDKKGSCWTPSDCYISASLVLTKEAVEEDARELRAWVEEIMHNIEYRDRWKKVYLNGGGYDSCSSCSTKNLCLAKSSGNFDSQTINLIGMKTDRGVYDAV